MHGHVSCDEIRNVFIEAIRKMREDHFGNGDRRPSLQEMETFLDDVRLELMSRGVRSAEALYATNPELRKDRPAPPAMTQLDSRDDYAEHKRRILDRVNRG